MLDMNVVFINKIFRDEEAWLMESETEDFLAELEIGDMQKSRPRNFDLYEEFSHASTDEVIRVRRESFDKADLETRRALVEKAEQEIENFCVWLTEIKNIDRDTAHYCSVSLKSLLIGLPMGEAVAQVFGAMLDAQIKE